MNPDDFRCMRRGAQLGMVNPQDAQLLETIDRRNGHKRTALLLLHGFSSTPAVFRYLLAGLPKYDALIAPALPGHARDLEAFSQLKASELLTFVEQIAEQLINEYDEVDVLGLSMGGVLAAHLSTRFTLRHLYLLAPAFDLHLAVEKMIQFARFCKWLGFRQFRSMAGNLYTSHACEIAYRQLPLTSIIELLTFINEFTFICPSCPTDVFLGSHDEVVASHVVALRFANQEKVNIHWLANSAHVLPLDGDIDSIIHCINANFSG